MTDIQLIPSKSAQSGRPVLAIFTATQYICIYTEIFIVFWHVLLSVNEPNPGGIFLVCVQRDTLSVCTHAPPGTGTYPAMYCSAGSADITLRWSGYPASQFISGIRPNIWRHSSYLAYGRIFVKFISGIRPDIWRHSLYFASGRIFVKFISGIRPDIWLHSLYLESGRIFVKFISGILPDFRQAILYLTGYFQIYDTQTDILTIIWYPAGIQFIGNAIFQIFGIRFSIKAGYTVQLS